MKYFILYSNCIPVKGKTRSIISDLFRSKYFFIPNDLYDILFKLKTYSIIQIYEEYGAENKPTLDEYFEFLEKHDLGFFTSNIEELSQFPEMELKWDKPSTITNAILEIDKSHNFDKWLDKALEELEFLGCECVELRFLSQLPASDFERIIAKFDNSRFTDIRLIFSYDNDLEFESLLNSYPRISRVMVFNASKAKIDTIFSVPIIFMDEGYDSHKSCGNIDEGRMLVDLNLFSESINFNNCLNRKISINTKGEILNCPSMLNTNYGNIAENSLTSVIENSDFRRFWNIRKDDITGCSECEFRYMCIDCRAFVEEPGDEFSKPLKCGYDPETNIWSDWSENPLKSSSLTFYNYQQTSQP